MFRTFSSDAIPREKKADNANACTCRGSFWVCEKSDGVRVLVLIVCVPDGPQEVYLVSAYSYKLRTVPTRADA